MKLNSNGMQKAAIISAITLSTVCIVAFAQSAPPPPAGGQQPQMGQQHGWRSGQSNGPRAGGPRGHMQGGHGLRIEQIARLKNSLKLTSAQTALWDKAEKAMQPAPELRARMQEQIKAGHDQTLAALADPKFDPRKFSADQEKQRADMQTQTKAKLASVREAWFSVYDSLDAGQRGQVREFLRARFESGGRGMGGIQGRGRGDHNQSHGLRDPQGKPAMGSMPAGPAGSMPPPPARP